MRTLFIAAALVLTGACANSGDVAESAAPSGRDCFRSEEVHGFGPIDDDSISIHVGANRKYAVSAPHVGRDLRWDETIVLNSRTGWICTGNLADVTVTGGDPIPRRFMVHSVERITETPVAETPVEAPAAEGS